MKLNLTPRQAIQAVLPDAIPKVAEFPPEVAQKTDRAVIN